MNTPDQIQGAILYESGPRRSDFLFRISLKAVIFNTQDQVLVVKEDGRDWWDLPGGGMDHGETVKQAFARELSEEVSLKGDFTYTPILVEDPKLLADLRLYQVRIVCVLHPEDISFQVGQDGDELEFVDPDIFKNAERPVERKIFEYCELAR